MATTTCRASTRRVVRGREGDAAGPPLEAGRPRVRSWIATPRSWATRAMPRHSLAGSSRTSRPGGRYRPACQSGEWTSAWAASRRGTRAARRARRPRRPRRGTPRPGTAWSASARVPVSSRSQSIPCSRVNAIRPARFSMPSRSRRSSSSGKWRMPLASPWVRLASQNPPLRPLAPNETSRLEHRDPEPRVGIGQGDRRPQAGEAGADDRDVDLEALARDRAADRRSRRVRGHVASRR